MTVQNRLSGCTMSSDGEFSSFDAPSFMWGNAEDEVMGMLRAKNKQKKWVGVACTNKVKTREK